MQTVTVESYVETTATNATRLATLREDSSPEVHGKGGREETILDMGQEGQCRLHNEPIVSKDERLDIDKMYLSVIDEELGYAVIPDEYKNWDLFEDDDSGDRTIYQIEGPHDTIAHDIHNKAIAETICKVPQMMWELKRCYEEIDEVTKWKDHWERTSQTWSKVVEIFDPKANNAELNDAINKAFGHDASE